MFNSKIILASKSPRRKQLLSYIFNNFNVLDDVDFEEPDPVLGQNPSDYVRLCVQTKLNQLPPSLKYAPKSLILVADTTVSVGKELLAKPKNDQDAKRMLVALSNKEHSVMTAFFLGSMADVTKSELISVSTSVVKFKKLSAKTIQQYIRSGEGKDKAGAYGFQGLGLQLIEKVSGSYSNIMGLPLEDIKSQALRLKIS